MATVDSIKIIIDTTIRSETIEEGITPAEMSDILDSILNEVRDRGIVWVANLAAVQVASTANTKYAGDLSTGIVYRHNGTAWVSLINANTGVPSMSLDNLTDVVLTAPVTNQLLQFNGSTWVNVNYTISNPTIQTLTDGTTVNMNVLLGKWGRVTLGGNRTLAFTNLATGDAGLIFVTQGVGGNKTLSYPGNSEIPTAGIPLSAGAGELTVLGYIYDGANIIFSSENYGAVSVPSDTTPPSRVSMLIKNGFPTKVDILFNEPLNNGSVSPTTSFSVSGKTVSGVAVVGSTVTLTVSVPFVYGDAPTCSYTAGANPIQDVSANNAVNWAVQPVTNQLPTADVTPPIFDSAVIQDNDHYKIYVFFNETLDAGSVPATTTFAVTGGRTITGLVINGSWVELTVNNAYTSSDVITVAYTQGVTKLRDLALNNVANFSAQSVTNNISTIPLLAPTLSLTVLSDTEIQADWTNVANETGYQIEKSTDNINWTLDGTMPTNSTTDTIMGLNGGTLYYIRIKALGGGGYGDSPYDTDSATTQAGVVDEYLTYEASPVSDNESYNTFKGLRRYQATANVDDSISTQLFENDDVFDFLCTSATLLAYICTGESGTPESYGSAKVMYYRDGSIHSVRPAGINTPVQMVENLSYVSGDWVRFVKKAGVVYVSIKPNGSTDWMVMFKSWVSNHAAQQRLHMYLYTTMQGIDELVKRNTVAVPNDFPLYFTAQALSGNTSIKLSWHTVTNATGYSIERATNARFTTALSTVYTGTSLTYTDTSLTNGTTYYYRIKATFAAGGDSHWTFNKATTSANGEYPPWEFPWVGTRLEPTADYRGGRKKIGFATGEATFVYSDTDVQLGEAIALEMSQASAWSNVALNTTKTPVPSSRFTNRIMVECSNGKVTVVEATVVQYDVQHTVGDHVRLANRSNNTTTVDVSTDGGATWATVYTSAISTTTSYKVGFEDNSASSKGAYRIYKMTGL